MLFVDIVDHSALTYALARSTGDAQLTRKELLLKWKTAKLAQQQQGVPKCHVVSLDVYFNARPINQYNFRDYNIPFASAHATLAARKKQLKPFRVTANPTPPRTKACATERRENVKTAVVSYCSVGRPAH